MLLRSLQLEDFRRNARVVPLHVVTATREAAPVRVKNGFSKIAIASDTGLHVIAVQDIIHCASENNYCHMYLKNGKSLFFAKTLKAVEALLPADQFFRTHRSHLIRVEDIVRIDTDQAELINGIKVPVARQHHHELLQRIQSITHIL